MTNVLDLRGLNIGVLSNLQALSIFKEVQRIDQVLPGDAERHLHRERRVGLQGGEGPQGRLPGQGARCASFAGAQGKVGI